jgi:hypothetical protein
MLAYVYSYPDGPTDRALAKVLHILAKLLTKPGQLHNSNTFSALLQFLWQTESVALLRCDNQGRVGILTPLWPRDRWCEDVTTIKVGTRGCYVGQCYYAQLDQWEEWQKMTTASLAEKLPRQHQQQLVERGDEEDLDDDVQMWRPQEYGDNDTRGDEQQLWLPSNDYSSNHPIVAVTDTLDEPFGLPSSSNQKDINSIIKQ